MLTKTAAFVMILLIFNISGVRVAFGQTTKEEQQTLKIKEKVAKIGKDKKVVVRLFDKTRMKGVLTTFDAETFAVTTKKDGTTTFKYSQVESVSKAGKLSPTTIGLIAGGAAATVIVLVTFFRYYCNEQAC